MQKKQARMNTDRLILRKHLCKIAITNCVGRTKGKKIRKGIGKIGPGTLKKHCT